jgi:hypothetical protein
LEYKNIESYLQGSNLCEVIASAKIVPPPKESDDALWKWRIKADKAMFVLKITIEEEPPLISSEDKEGSSN